MRAPKQKGKKEKRRILIPALALLLVRLSISLHFHLCCLSRKLGLFTRNASENAHVRRATGFSAQDGILYLLWACQTVRHI